MSALLAAQGLHVAVAGRPLVNDLHWQLEPGQCWALLGRNGAGKTRLLHTLAGLLAPAAGQVLLDGKPLNDLARRAIARRLGLMPQDTADVFPGTVMETALLGRHPHLGPLQSESLEDCRLADAALAAVDLGCAAGRDVGTLSGGERRRLAFATLLTQNPAVWLLDEPLNHLDLPHAMGTLEWLSSVAASGCGVLQSLHDPSLAARRCSHALLLYGDGRWEAGSADEMLTQTRLSNLYRHPLRTLAGPHGPVFVPA